MSEVLVVIPTIVEHPQKYYLLSQLYHEKLVKRVLVVDNGDCFPGGVKDKRLTPAWSKIQRIRPKCNLNWLHSCNLGAAIALEKRIPYVCFLNDDVSISRNFFENILVAFDQNPDAAVVVPSYNGEFSPAGHDDRHQKDWTPTPEDISVPYTDGTCMVLALKTIETVGFLDPTFRHPGWGADVDYAYRTIAAGSKVYITRRAMLWHRSKIGGTSAAQIYGSRDKWTARGCQQAREDLEAKYGTEWRELLSLPPNSYA